MLTGDPERDGDEAEVAPLREYWADVPASVEDAARELLGWWSAFAGSATGRRNTWARWIALWKRRSPESKRETRCSL